MTGRTGMGVPLALAMMLLAVPAAGQERSESSASKAADAFTLQLPTVAQDEAVTTPAEPPAAEVVTPGVVAPPAAALFSLDTPIDRLVADPRARAVLDKDLPGLSDDENLPKFRALSLRRFQPLTGGQLTDALLAKVEADLAAIRPAPTGKGRNTGR